MDDRLMKKRFIPRRALTKPPALISNDHEPSALLTAETGRRLATTKSRCLGRGIIHSTFSYPSFWVAKAAPSRNRCTREKSCWESSPLRSSENPFRCALPFRLSSLNSQSLRSLPSLVVGIEDSPLHLFPGISSICKPTEAAVTETDICKIALQACNCKISTEVE